MRPLPLAAVLLVGTLAVASQAHAFSEKVIYAFQGGTDGAVPVARLLYSNGLLYGTTSQGGAPYNLGTLFQITLSGTESVLARFPGGNLGATPLAGLTELNGVLYGTTQRGGAPDCNAGSAYGCGVVYGFTPAGGLSPLHVFRGVYTDGALPAADLTVSHGVLFGTTTAGGTYGPYDGTGTVFKIAPDAREHLLFTFYGYQEIDSGNTPLGGLTAAGGLLYGTLSQGGDNVGGQLYSTDSNGKVAFGYSFPASLQKPVGDLLKVKGLLYGVTLAGALGCGEVYDLNPSDGSVQVLYSFGSGQRYDGCGPTAGLTFLHGKFFGVTGRGGTYNEGTIFELRTDGTEHVVHSFGNRADGANPAAALIPVNGTLYGTTQNGGIWDGGTVFSLTPSSN